MRILTILLPVLAMSFLLSSGDCLAMGSADKSALPAPAKETSREALQRAKQNDQALIGKWEQRLLHLSMAQTGSGPGRLLSSFGRPYEDPTRAAFSTDPSDFETDIQECQQQIQMLKENIKYYDQELAKIKKEEENRGDSGEGGGGGGH